MATLIQTDGTETEVKPKRGRYFRLEELQCYVGGLIQIEKLSDGRVMVINEEGIAEGLLPNKKATALYGVNVVLGDIEILRDYAPTKVLGDVVVCLSEEVI